MTLKDTRTKKIADLKSFMLRVGGSVDAVKLFELV